MTDIPSLVFPCTRIVHHCLVLRPSKDDDDNDDDDDDDDDDDTGHLKVPTPWPKALYSANRYKVTASVRGKCCKRSPVITKSEQQLSSKKPVLSQHSHVCEGHSLL